MNKSKNKNMKPAENDQEYLSNVMRQTYELQLKLIEKKIARREKWAVEWPQQIKLTEKQIEEVTRKEKLNIDELKKTLQEAQQRKLDLRQDHAALKKKVADEFVNYQNFIVDMDNENDLKICRNEFKIAALELKIAEIQYFKENKEKIREDYEQKETKMAILEEKHQEKLTALTLQKERFQKLLQFETEKEFEKASKQFTEAFSQITGGEFDENSQLHGEFANLIDQMNEMTHTIPEILMGISELTKDIRLREEELQEIQRAKLRSKKKDIEAADSSGIIGYEAATVSEHTLVDSESEERSDIQEKLEEKEMICDKDKILFLKTILKEAEKIVKEAQAVNIVPEGGLPEEAKLRDEEIGQRYDARRRKLQKKRIDALEYMLQILDHRNSDTSILEKTVEPTESTSTMTEDQSLLSDLHTDEGSTTLQSSTSGFASQLQSFSSSSLTYPESYDGYNILRGLSQLSFDQYPWSLDA